MHIINLTPLDAELGLYNDHNSDTITNLPAGWAMIPEDFELPATFPWLGSQPEVKDIVYLYDVEVSKVNEETGEIEFVKEQREKVISTVISMTEGTPPKPIEPEPTAEEQLRADVDFIAAMTGIKL